MNAKHLGIAASLLVSTTGLVFVAFGPLMVPHSEDPDLDGHQEAPGHALPGALATSSPARLSPRLTLLATPQGRTFVLPQPVGAVAFLGASEGMPTGRAAFFLCGPADVDASGCPGGKGAAVGLGEVNASGWAMSPFREVSGPAGRHCWRADYSGDETYLPAGHTNAGDACFRLRVLPTIALASEPGGISSAVEARARVAVTGTVGVPTGAVEFFLCDPIEVEARGGDCHYAGAPVGGAVALSASRSRATSVSSPVALLSEGKHCWLALYGGDDAYLPRAYSGGGAECVTLTRAS